jgi:hypothetical protein
MSEVIRDGAIFLQISLRLSDRVSWPVLIEGGGLFSYLINFIWRNENIVYFSDSDRLSFTYELCSWVPVDCPIFLKT